MVSFAVKVSLLVVLLKAITLKTGISIRSPLLGSLAYNSLLYFFSKSLDISYLVAMLFMVSLFLTRCFFIETITSSPLFGKIKMIPVFMTCFKSGFN
jgi:hypothetical protein